MPISSASAVMRTIPTCVLGIVVLASWAAAQGVQTTPSNSWVTDGSVDAVAVRGTTVYLAGLFKRVGPKTGPLVAIDTVTGEPIAGMPRVRGGLQTIERLAPDGLGGYIIAGQFTLVDEAPRPGLARIVNGVVDPNFVPQGFTYATQAVVIGARVFAQVWHDGQFSLRVFDLATGRTEATWAAPAGSFPGGAPLRAGPNNSLLLLGPVIVALDAATGAELWRSTPGGTSLTVDGTVGYFAAGSTVHRLNLLTGASEAFVTAAGPNCSLKFPCYVQSVTAYDGRLYLLGMFGSVEGVARNGSAAVDLRDKTVLPWVLPNLPGTVPSVSEAVVGDGPRLLAFYSNTIVAVDPVSGADTGWRAHLLGGPGEIVPEPSRLIVAGRFSGAGGVGRVGLAAVEWPTGVPTAWNPNLSLPRSLFLSSLALQGTRLFVASYDQLFEIDAVTGTPAPWSVSVQGGLIGALSVAEGRLFVGGAFNTVGGISRTNLASINIAGATPSLEAWTPNLSPTPFGVLELLAVPGVVLFSQPITSVESNVGAIDSATAMPVDWEPAVDGLPIRTPASFDIAHDRLWVSGPFHRASGPATHGGQAAFDLSGRPVAWRAEVPANVILTSYEVQHYARVFGSRLYVGGGYALDVATGSVARWRPDLEGNTTAGRWFAAGELGVILYNTGRNGFAFFPSVPPPPGPSGLTASAAGQSVQLSWQPVAGEVSYVIEAGTAPGRADLVTFDTQSAATTFATSAPAGTYYVRVRANADEGGIGEASNELKIVLGANACATPPGSPLDLASTQKLGAVALRWSAPASNAPVTRYVVQVGSTSGAANLAAFDVGPNTAASSGAVPSGTYFVRVIAENRCGASPPSNELRLVFP